ncbi:dihydrofolate reductase [Nakamurella leprariae]|uniref:Dihydrofolate reductase n=1 Tax=Nakamurella leprariae TaxID=2803911 RepID=A0A938YE13_9ACTN|nr:dihydrofolate reductase [Nakamurella leprariae]MBM9466038.1 dihydrofolate reductase [Nakamurella leprariae]
MQKEMQTEVQAGMEIVLVAAVARGGIIGADGGMPWHLPEDLRRFRAMTLGHALVMGRRTFGSIGRPLPGRRTVVVTRDRSFCPTGVEVAGSIDDALGRVAARPQLDPAGHPRPVMVVGGGQIYRQTIDLADRLEITEVDQEVAGDTVFPPIDPDRWREAARRTGDGCTYLTYARA